MPRKPRSAAGGVIYHVLNRGNCRLRIFHKHADYLAFLKLMEEARRRTGMRVLAYCLMPNHFHMVLWPKTDGELSHFMGWLCTTHVRRWREHRGSVGEGHLYQGRFKSFPVASDEHLLVALRYVESNALRAALVARAEQWEWSSLRRFDLPSIVMLSPWPVSRPRNWMAMVNESLAERELEKLRASVKRGRPFGSQVWQDRIAKRLGLEATLRNPWRPKKKPAVAGPQ